MKRYPEGGDVPTLSFEREPEGDVDARTALRTKRRTKYLVPNTPDVNNNRSNTSSARRCFVDREFSSRLQDFMLSYSYTLVTTKVLSGEV